MFSSSTRNVPNTLSLVRTPDIALLDQHEFDLSVVLTLVCAPVHVGKEGLCFSYALGSQPRPVGDALAQPETLQFFMILRTGDFQIAVRAEHRARRQNKYKHPFQRCSDIREDGWVQKTPILIISVLFLVNCS